MEKWVFGFQIFWIKYLRRVFEDILEFPKPFEIHMGQTGILGLQIFSLYILVKIDMALQVLTRFVQVGQHFAQKHTNSAPQLRLLEKINLCILIRK